MSDLAMDVAYGKAPAADGAFRRSVHWGNDGGALVRAALTSGKPALVARLGSSELACASFYTRWRQGRVLPLPYPRGLRHIMSVNAGVFPTDDAALDTFSIEFLEAVSRTDVMGVWFNRNEERITERYCPRARLVYLEALNPLLLERPWTSVLAGRVVLVVHPFARTIESQYRTARTSLFSDPDMLPSFELKTLRAVQSGAGGRCEYRTWLDALTAMREQVTATGFDVALIGAGAYGLPLAATVKDLGRQAVHLGGATQLLFGVRGRRWEIESPDDLAPLFNDHWVRPSPEETPDDAESVEGGCYW